MVQTRLENTLTLALLKQNIGIILKKKRSIQCASAREERRMTCLEDQPITEEGGLSHY